MGEIRRLLTENDELRDKIQELLAENARLKASKT